MIHLTDKTLTDPIAVIGIQIRTNNASELSGQGQIGALWGRLFAENLPAQIPNRASESIFAVSTIENIPAGMTYIAIPTGDYAVFTSETGPVVEVVQAAWKHIWAVAATDLGRK